MDCNMLIRNKMEIKLKGYEFFWVIGIRKTLLRFIKVLSSVLKVENEEKYFIEIWKKLQKIFSFSANPKFLWHFFL